MRQELHGRVFIGAAPDTGPHPGYRGLIQYDAAGIYINEDCEVLAIKDEPEAWPDSEWELSELTELIPWHRVYSIDTTKPV